MKDGVDSTAQGSTELVIDLYECEWPTGTQKSAPPYRTITHAHSNKALLESARRATSLDAFGTALPGSVLCCLVRELFAWRQFVYT